MLILGIGADVWMASACLLQDGTVVAAAAEERFNREKLSRVFPERAIQYCLSRVGCDLADVDHVASGWNPGRHISYAAPRLVENLSFRGQHIVSVPGRLLAMMGRPPIDQTDLTFHAGGASSLNVIFVSHHAAHAANGFFMSPFDRAAILSVDGRGEDTGVFLGGGEGGRISELEAVKLPFSVGDFYSAMTSFLGFQHHADEWKVMALAALGDPDTPHAASLRRLIRYDADTGRGYIDAGTFTSCFVDIYPRRFSERLQDRFGPPRDPGDPFQQNHYDVARACQIVFEEIIVGLACRLHRLWPSENLVLTGGCAMNTVLNGKIEQLTPFKRLFVSSCPDDSGISLGAALKVHHDKNPGAARRPQEHNFWGPDYSDDEIDRTLQHCQVPASTADHPGAEAAARVARHAIVGWFQGGMEFGHRALGARSILADPRSTAVRERLIRTVKIREDYRPFAASVLAEHAPAYFEMPATARIPFMEKVVRVRPEMRDTIAAVVHTDGSCRVQTVDERTMPAFRSLLEAFHARTGIPLVLNTSMNASGEPMVCSPTDAVRTFFGTGLDALVIGRYVVEKSTR